ncbi:hypothetical protein [Maricaulis sp.]|uniref:hypothetical protein n=1 Tax=Maricaulis sp. TaxID=1486257 RepID=UPI002B271DB8|nr:hypothetical protein [Maricaulis sp.]
MILARLTAAIREQSWFAVVLEFVIVVAGVLLAFQISAWSGERADRAYARDILDRLHAELIVIGTVRNRVRPQLEERVEQLNSARPVIMGVSDREVLTTEECYHIGRSHLTPAPPDQLPTLDELLASGSLRVIDNSALRRNASALEAMSGAGRGSWTNLSALFDNLAEHYPGAIQPVLVAAVAESGDQAWSRAYHCDLENMRAQPDFQAALLENISVLDSIAAYNYRTIDAMIETVHAAIDDELGIDHTADRGAEEDTP